MSYKECLAIVSRNNRTKKKHPFSRRSPGSSFPTAPCGQARFDWVQEEIARQLQQISSFNERHEQAKTRLEAEVPDVPADSDSEAGILRSTGNLCVCWWEDAWIRSLFRRFWWPSIFGLWKLDIK